MALIRCLAGHFGWDIGKATELAGVIDLDQVAVVVLCDQLVSGEEEGVGAVGAGAEQARIKGAGASGDQVEAAGRGLTGFEPRGVRAAFLPLIDILPGVVVPGNQRVGRGEEDPAVIGEVKPLRDKSGVAYGFDFSWIAGNTGKLLRRGCIAIDLQVAGVVIRFAQWPDRGEDSEVAARGDLEVSSPAGRRSFDRVEDDRVVGVKGGDEVGGSAGNCEVEVGLVCDAV